MNARKRVDRTDAIQEEYEVREAAGQRGSKVPEKVFSPLFHLQASDVREQRQSSHRRHRGGAVARRKGWQGGRDGKGQWQWQWQGKGKERKGRPVRARKAEAAWRLKKKRPFILT